LGLKPVEFWQTTPSELFDLSEGYLKRQRTRLEENAILACWIVNQSGWRGGKALHPRDLVRMEATEKPLTKEELEAMAWQHKQKFWTKIGDKYIKKEDK